MVIDKKKNAVGTLVFLMGILVVFAVFDFVKQDIGREQLLQITSYIDFFSNVKAVNGVYLADNDYYIEQHLPQTYPASLQEEKLVMLDKLLQDYPQTQVILIPTADNILTDYLPWQAPYLEERNLVTGAEDAIGDDHVVDVFPAFVEHYQEGVYFKTDSHITTTGAYYVYQKWAKQTAGPTFWYRLDKLKEVTGDFSGDMVKKVGVKSGSVEPLSIFPNVLRKEVSIIYDNKKISDTYFEEEKLSSVNPYEYFLDGDHGVTIIDTGYKNSKTLFIMKDSYANVVIPLLAPHYEKIYAVDVQLYTGDVKELMRKCSTHDSMDVLLIYGCDGFLEQFEY